MLHALRLVHGGEDSVDGFGAVASSGRCPGWCELPEGHGWAEGGAGSGDLVRIHQLTLAIPGTVRGSVMVVAAEYPGPDGVARDAVSFVVDTGAGDCELDAAGARGLLRVLQEALGAAGVPR
ncbi:hypothetical protein OG921_26250 [Aldersonia sp. NBC_00410]|uniref:hypothetical protein n=1 Tax=Aldersonia sp. NBC_00410 TaxID=2975954 RepID=UPI002251C8F7|nr:hypothetical protein [Aldersonia sp. NBC_00410]MCX5046681.1 hypothetical protein [Aldersonia sp. NBC_00410]